MIASSVNKENWLKEIPADKPALIIAEGLFSYLSKQEVKTLLNRLTDYFTNGQVIFNTISSYTIHTATKNLKKTTGAVQKWAVNDIREVDQLNLKLKRIEAIPLFKSPYIRKLPFMFRTLLRLANLFPKYRNMIQLMRYQF